MKQKIIVTGAAGFLGSFLCQALDRAGWEVIGLDNLSQGTERNLSALAGSPGFRFVRGDVRDQELLNKLAQDAYAIVHFASYKIPRYGHVEETLSVNLEGTETVLEAARQSGARVLYGSTEDTYGKNNDVPLTEESTLILGSPSSSRWSDAVSKICAEQLCYAFAEAYGVEFSVLRYGNIYGPNNRLDWWGGVIGVFIDCALQRKRIPIHGDGTQSRAFLYVEDAVSVTLAALTSDLVCGEVVNVGSDESIRVVNLAYLVWRLAENEGKPDLEFIPYQDLSPNYEDVHQRLLDCSKAKFLLDFTPGWDLKAGLRQTIAWRKETMKRSDSQE